MDMSSGRRIHKSKWGTCYRNREEQVKYIFAAKGAMTRVAHAWKRGVAKGENGVDYAGGGSCGEKTKTCFHIVSLAR